jgi:hypothetical protein
MEMFYTQRMKTAIAALLALSFLTTGCMKTATVTPPGSSPTAWQKVEEVIDAGLAALTATDPNLPYIGTVDTCVAAITKAGSTWESDTSACAGALAQSGAAGPVGSLIASGISVFLASIHTTPAPPVPAATIAEAAQLHQAVTAAKK